jgi:hypothetical protein
MPDYRLYRLRTDNSIIEPIDIHVPDDETAISEAIRIDHAAYIEIWCGARMVSRVAPKAVPSDPVAPVDPADGGIASGEGNWWPFPNPEPLAPRS